MLTDNDILKIREQFPVLKRTVYGKPLIYLDNTATSQTPQAVIDRLDAMYTMHHANVHRGVHCVSQEATDMLEKTRTAVARFINAPDRDCVIFTRGTTEAINLVAATVCRGFRPGDEIVLTVMEHHSNIVPWQLAAGQYGLKIRVAQIMPDGSLDLDAYRSLFGPKTRLAAFAHVSNVLGTVNPVREMAAIAHSHGCLALVDGAQAVAHYAVDVQDIDADFYVFSSHKMYGPTGVGVLYGRREVLEAMPPYQGGGEMIAHVSFDGTTFAALPFKFEAGTPDYTAIPPLCDAIDFINNLSLKAIEAHEDELLHYTTGRLLDEVPGIRIFGTAPGKCPLISFLLGNAHHYDTGLLLDKLGIAVRTGHHCAQPLMQSLGIEGTVRASFAVYNTRAEADAFVDGVRRVAAILQ